MPAARPEQMSLPIEPPADPEIDPADLRAVISEMTADARALIAHRPGMGTPVAALRLRLRPHRIHNRPAECTAVLQISRDVTLLDDGPEGTDRILTDVFRARIAQLCAQGRLYPAWRAVFRRRNFQQIPLDVTAASQHARLAAQDRLARMRGLVASMPRT